MKLLLPLLFFLSVKAQAYVHFNSNSGLGSELLLNGAGQARLGSNGAQNSNPSLLAWLPKRHEYLSINTIKMTRYEFDDGKVNSPASVIPLSALSTEGFGDWGHSYGVSSNSELFKSISDSVGGETSVEQNREFIGFGYGFGKRIDNFAYGLALNIERITSQVDSISTTNENGFTTFLTNEQSFSFWNLSLNPGVTSRHGDWSFGLSSKFTILKTNASFKNKTTIYSEEFDSYSKSTDHRKEAIQNIPEIRTGVQKRFDSSFLHFDLVYVPAYTDKDFDYPESDVIKGILAFDQSFLERFRYYTSVSYTPAVELTNPVGEFSLGFSKQNKHSTNFLGSSLRKNLEGPEYMVVQIIFGSTFLY